MLYESFIKATSLPKEKQKQYLESVQLEYPDIFSELLEMIKDDQASEALDTSYWSSMMKSESSEIIHTNEDLTGTVIGSFKLIEHVDQGGMGSVYKALRCDGKFEQTVAIKIIHRELEHIIGEHALIREAGFMAKLTHPNIGKVFDAGISDDGHHFIIMEFIDGCAISDRFSEIGLTLNEKLSLFCDLCDAVNHAHQMQVIHADLKPANILITNDNQVKVLDFGIARMFDSRSSDSAKAYTAYLNAMTASYASPELLSGEKPSMYSDIFALGKVFLSLFGSSTQKTIKYKKELQSIGLHACHPLATERYSSVVELKQDIQNFINGYTASAFKPNKWYRLKKFAVLRHPIATLFAIAIASVVTFLLIRMAIQNKNLVVANQQSDLVIEKLSEMLTLIDKKKTNGAPISPQKFLKTSSALIEDNNLNINSKAQLKLTLANSYNSNGDIGRAQELYKELIGSIEQLEDTDIAFEAAAQHARLLVHLYDLDKIDPEIGGLLNYLTFHEISPKLPATPTQALYYHRYLDGMKYIQSDRSSRIAFGLKHIELLRLTIDHYWSDLSTLHQAEVSGFLARSLYTQFEFESNTIYPFEQTPLHYFEQFYVPKLIEIEKLLKESIALHVQNNGLDDVARGELIFAGIYSLFNEPEKALAAAKKSLAYSHQVLGENHPNLINRYGELSKDFLYSNPAQSVEYAKRSVQLAKQFKDVSHAQYLLALLALLNSLESAGEFAQYRVVAEQYFQYYVSIDKAEHSPNLTALVIEVIQSYYLVTSAPPENVEKLIPQVIEEIHSDASLAVNNEDYIENLTQFLTAIHNEPSIENNRSLASSASIDQDYFSAIKLLREKVHLLWYQSLTTTDVSALEPLAVFNAIPWSKTESSISVFKIDVMVKIASILIKNKQFTEAEKLIAMAQNIHSNKNLAKDNGWFGQIELLRAEMLLVNGESKKALELLRRIEAVMVKSFSTHSLIKQRYNQLLNLAG